MLTYLSEEESMTRTWLTAPEGACPICAPLNGYTVRFDAQYPNGLEHRISPCCVPLFGIL